MRLPLVPGVSTKDGVTDKNARMTNALKETSVKGVMVVVRPVISTAITSSGVGNGISEFDGELITVFGATVGWVDSDGAPGVIQTLSTIDDSFHDFVSSTL